MVKYTLLLASIMVFSVGGAPHHDGSDSHTHAPVVAPDSESIIISLGDTHHSDVYLTKSTPSSNKDKSEMVSGGKEIDAAEIHHADAYMMKNMLNNTSEAHIDGSTTHVMHETVSTSVSPTTETTRGKNENNGAHPVAPVYHGTQQKKGVDGITKSIVAHSPVASFVEGSKSEKVDKHHQSKTDNSSSVVAHGPMIKSEIHDRKHGSDGSIKSTVHSTVQHAPMATEHHPPKNIAHHPSLSKNVPISSGHAPLLKNPVIEDRPKTVEPVAEDITEKVEIPEIHPPTATDHHHPEFVLGQNHSAGNTDAVPAGSHHAPMAIPHEDKDKSEIHVEKRSQMDSPAETVTSTPKIIEVHHPLLSKTEAAVPMESLKINHVDVKKDEHDVTSTTEINGNALETQQINSGRHPGLAQATISPSS